MGNLNKVTFKDSHKIVYYSVVVSDGWFIANASSRSSTLASKASKTS